MLQLAIVGLGDWGRRLVDSVQGKSETARFAVAVAPRPERAADFARAHDLKIETDYAAVLRDPAIRGIVSCGPAHLHAAHALAAIEAGKPVLAIKPMAVGAKEALGLKAAADAHKVLLALGYNRCYFPNVVELRRRLKAGALGRILHTEGNFCVDRYAGIPASNWKADPANVPAGSLADHMLYLTVETLGEIADVHAIGTYDVTPNGLSDATAVLLHAKSGCTGLLTAIGVTPDFYRFHVFGTEGWAELRGSREFSFQPRSGTREDLVLPALDAERAEIEGFVAAIEGRVPFPVSAADAAHGVAVLDAMGRSAIEKRMVAVT